MNNPDPSDDDQAHNPKAFDIHQVGEKPKRHARGVIHRLFEALHTERTQNQLSSMIEGEPFGPPIPASDQELSSHPGQERNPGRRLQKLQSAGKNHRPAGLPWRYRLRPNHQLAHRAYWDVAATFSLIVNAILITLLLYTAGQVRNLRTNMNNLLGGIYGSLAKMDQASLNTTVQVNAQIPLDLDIPITQNTQAVLNTDISIPNAHLFINSGILRINTQANVTIPAGTILPVNLNMNVPVHSTIPISLQVPVNIPLSQTELHEPLSGIQTILRSIYCMFDKNAQYPEGIYLCAEHDIPTPGGP